MNGALLAIARTRTLELEDSDDDNEDEVTHVHDTLEDLVRAPALVVSVEAPIATVRSLLAENRAPAVVAFDRNDALRGVVTRTDVLRASDHCSAGDAMSTFMLVLAASATIVKAAALIGYEGVSFVVVADRRGGLCGLVSAVDIVRHFAILAGTLRR